MLKFNKDGKFGILLFGDLHEKPDCRESLRFKDMQKLMNASLERYKPDLCVLLGDIFDTEVCRDDPAAFSEYIELLCRPMTSKGIPVAAIMGNHEHDPGCDDEVIKAYSELSGVMMRCEGVPGKADYKEILYSHDGKKPLAALWFLDSNNLCADESASKYDYVHTDQIEWFEKESEKLREINGGKPMPSYIFQHIPVPEEYELLRPAKLYEIPWSVDGFGKQSGTRFVKAEGTQGYLGEGPCSPDINNGQFESWKRTGGVRAAFFGHDHLNDFSGFVDGIFLAQHKTAGFRAYTDGCHSCVRFIEISENDPGSFRQELRHYKDFGINCECLGPVMKRFTDRQVMAVHSLNYCACALASAGLLTYFVKEIIKERRERNG